MIRPLKIVALTLAIPIVPFLFFGNALEARVQSLLDPPPGPATIAGLVVGVLATDIFLPVPSSAVCTVAGASLGVVVGAAASFCGMTLGSVFGYWLALRYGRAIASRFAGESDLEKIESVAARFGPGLLLLLRPLPVLAEASVLIFGTVRLGWRRFLPPVVAGNLAIAIIYALLGWYASEKSYLPPAIVVSMAVPVLLTEAVRRRMAR